ncbi:uncharacterized protein LJ206_019592 [Theristicus caerulescens]
MTKPRAPTTGAPGKPVDLPEQGPDAFAKALPEQAEDTTASHMLTWLDTTDSEDTIPDVPSSPSLTAFLHELPDLSEYVAEGGCPKKREVVAGLGDSEGTDADAPDIPDLTTFLNKLPHFLEYRAYSSSHKDRAAVAGLGDDEVTVNNVPDSTDFLSHLPDFSDLASAAFLNELHDFSEYVTDGDCPQDQAMVAQLGDREDTILTANVPSLTTDIPNELPNLSEYVGGDCPNEREVAAGMGHGEDTVPSVPVIPSLTTSLNKQRVAPTRSKWQR